MQRSRTDFTIIFKLFCKNAHTTFKRVPYFPLKKNKKRIQAIKIRNIKIQQNISFTKLKKKKKENVYFFFLFVLFCFVF